MKIQWGSLSRVVACTAAFACLFHGAPARAQSYLNAQTPWHPAVLDSQGRVLAWFHPEKNLGYDQFLRLDWDFLEHKVPISTVTGVKVYLTAPIFDGTTLQGVSWQHNPAGTFAHQMDALLGWYPYSGDPESVEVLRTMLDYQLAHGTTPADWDWSEIPFATSCRDDKEYGRCIRDMPHEYFGGIETDKIGELGLSYVQFYELTGDKRYLDAGIKCATQLAKHIRRGDATHTPWPFRVDAHTGVPLAGEEYGGMIVAPVRLFDELLRIGAGNTASYKIARDTAWTWILENPLNKKSAAWDKWSGYYEDVVKDTVNVNDMTAMMTAYYILSRESPETVDPEWELHVGHLLDRSRVLLGRGPFFGAWAIDEQLRPDGGALGGAPEDQELQPRGTGALLGVDNRGCCSRAGLVCRTSQWGAINAMYFEKTLDGQAKEDAFRSLNYATYFAESNGKIHCCGLGHPNPLWFEDGYADAGRSFIWAMGAVPEFAPIGESHLLRSSSVVQKVSYARGAVQYQTFDEAGTEVLRLAFKPGQVTGDGKRFGLLRVSGEEGYTIRGLPGGGYEVRVRRTAASVVRIKS